MSTKRISTLILAATMLFLGQGCAGRKQQAVDRSMLIQENLQLDQALSIAQYELMLAQQENEALRARIGQPSASDGRLGNGSGGRMPPLRSDYEPMSNGVGSAPSFDAYDPNLPQPSNQMPQRFRQQQPNVTPPQNQEQYYQGQGQSDMRQYGTSSPVMQASGVQYVEVPPDAPQWSPRR